MVRKRSWPAVSHCQGGVTEVKGAGRDGESECGGSRRTDVERAREVEGEARFGVGVRFREGERGGEKGEAGISNLTPCAIEDVSPFSQFLPPAPLSNPQPLLASRRQLGTHNLQLDPLALQFDGPNLEIDTDGGDEARRPSVVAEAEKQAGLADAL